MPEPYWPKKKGTFSLSDVHRLGHLLRISCRYCKTLRHFTPDDLRRVFGDIEVDDVIYQMRCSECRKTHTLDVEMVSPSAAERQRITLRRVDKIDYVRRVTWRDEGG
ncbi:MAG: hypothetical protein JJ969_10755 [Rhizobiaceae bacterium]|nr:hypothetical protein [Rhizobiaceae bacterium]